MPRLTHNARRARGEYVKNDNLTRREYEIVRLYMRKTPEQIRSERMLQQSADRIQHQSRQLDRRRRFDHDLNELYGGARASVAAQILQLEAARGLKGLFASIVRFKQRLTGEIAVRDRQIAGLRKTMHNLDMRIIEQRAAFERDIARDAFSLANRHRTQRDRDERLIAHARSRTERERMGLKARMNFMVRADTDQKFVPKPEQRQKLRTDLESAARDSGPGVLDRLIQNLGGPAGVQSRDQALANDQTADTKPAREKRWTRAEGRGANRQEGRTRNRTRRRERE